jgi:hypothetical protein
MAMEPGDSSVGLGRRAGLVYGDASPRRIRMEVEDSLRRLKTDYIDISQAVTDPVGPGFVAPPAPPGGPMLASRPSSRRGQTVVP